MPPEPLPWDRKDFFKERKHERSSESLGSVARWRDSSHHGSRDFNRWGSADFRRPPGHGKQGGWHLFPEESGHGYVPSRSGDKMLEDDSSRPTVSRGDGKYGRSSRDNRLGQRDWKVHSWETSNGSPNTSGRLLDVSNNVPRSVDDMITCPSHPSSDFVNTWDQLHLKDQHDKMGVLNGLGTGQRCDRENSLGSTDWKPLKWSRSGSLSSRGSGFSHSSSSKSMGGVDSNETKVDMQLKNVTPVQSPSGDAAACVTSAAPSEETTSKKKPRLGWGEGLAKYEKKKVEGPDVSVSKDGAVVPYCAEPTHSFISNMADKSPRVSVFSDCASPTTPSSVACSSSPGVEEKLFGKAANIDNDNGNICVSPSTGSQSLLEGFPFNLEKLDTNLIANLGSSLVELLLSDDSSSVDSSFVRSTAINKLLICKSEVSKALEITESEIDSLETELKLLKSESERGDPCPAASSSLPEENSVKSCKEQDAISNLILRPTPLQVVSSRDTAVENTPLCNGALEEVHAAVKDEDVDSPGTATSKFVEPLTLVKAVSSSVKVENDDSSGDLDASQIQPQKMDVKCSVPGSGGEKIGDALSIDVSLRTHKGGEDVLCKRILTTNREFADAASEVFNKLLPSCQQTTNTSQAATFSFCQNSSLIQEKFAMRKKFLRFNERVLTLKFKVFQHLWKEDMRLLSVRKHRPKSQKKFELSLRGTVSGNQKHRSSIRSRFSSPAGNLSLVPTTEMLNFTSKLLSDSQVKHYRNTLKMPALILDKKEKVVSRFISSNGLVEDPCAVEKERALINPWTPEEKAIFIDKLASFGKDFRKIASFLDHKTTADCVDFYYKNHKSDSFEKTKKQDHNKQAKSSTSTYLVTSGKKWNWEMNAASLDMLGAASMMAARADDCARSRQSSAGRVFLGGYSDSKTFWGDEGILEGSSSHDILGNERETVAVDVLAGICGSLSSEAMGSCITSSVDPGESYREWKCQKVDPLTKWPLTPDVTVDEETCSDESCGEMDPSDWTDEEKSIFIQAVSSYGKDFSMIARCLRTRSQDQCKVFFSKARKCLGLDLMHPGPRTVGTPVSDDANGGGSDMEDACVVEAGETGSVVCGNKSGCKLDEDLPLRTTKMNHDESDPSMLANLQSDMNKAEERNGIGHMDHAVGAVEMMTSNACQSENRSELAFCDDSNIGDAVVNAEKCSVVSVNTEPGADQVCDPGVLIARPVAVGEGIDSVLLNSEALPENQAVTSEGFGKESKGQELLLPENSFNDRQDEKSDGDRIGQSGLACSNQDSNTTGNASHVGARSSCSGFSLNPEYQHNVCLKSDSGGEPHITSLPQLNSSSATSVPQDSAAISCDKTLNQDRLSSTHDFQSSRDRYSPKSVSRDDFHQNLSGNPLLNRSESSQILRGYPMQMSNKKDMNEDVSCRKLCEVQTLSQSDRSISTRYLTQDCYLQKCSSSKPQCPVAELPLLSQNIEQGSAHVRSHSRSLSDTDKPCRNGDVKLFGQILSHPSSMQKPNSSTHENEEKGIHSPKLSSKSNLKYSGHHNVDGSSTLLKFDRNNNLGLENVGMRSYGFWDGNRIQTGFPSLPDSTILLAKYPTAFGNYASASSKIEQPALQAVVKGNERNLNGLSVFPTREMSSSNGVVDYQVYRSREGSKVQPFTVDMKQRQGIFSELQRRNGFEAVSSIQGQGRGMVGMNVVSRGGVIVGGPCTGVSDPVAALKMHYAKADQYAGQPGSVVREEESWRGKGGDMGR